MYDKNNIKPIKGSFKNYKEERLLKIVVDFLFVFFILFIFIEGIRILLSGVGSFEITWFYNRLRHEVNHRRECSSGGKIIANLRFIPNGINPWLDIKRCFLAPYEKNIKLWLILLSSNVIYSVYLCISYSINLGMGNLVVSIPFAIIAFCIIGKSSSGDFKSIDRVLDVLKEHNISETEAYIEIYEEGDNNSGVVYIQVYTLNDAKNINKENRKDKVK